MFYLTNSQFTYKGELGEREASLLNACETLWKMEQLLITMLNDHVLNLCPRVADLSVHGYSMQTDWIQIKPNKMLGLI